MSLPSIFYSLKEGDKMLERDFQRKLIKSIKDRFLGCIVLKNDSDYIQGIPDLMILYKDKWACLEVKNSARAARRPNQEHYVKRMDDMSFASFIYPENEEDVLDELSNFFGACSI